jgi:hypothetical protein
LFNWVMISLLIRILSASLHSLLLNYSRSAVGQFYSPAKVNKNPMTCNEYCCILFLTLSNKLIKGFA